LLSILITSCNFSEKELIGIYSPVNYRNTFDIIKLKKDSLYFRKVYDSNKDLVLKNQGKWSVKENVIKFESPYFYNLDSDLVKFPELLKDTLSNGGGYIWSKDGVIEFCVRYYAADESDQNCYKKLN